MTGHRQRGIRVELRTSSGYARRARQVASLRNQSLETKIFWAAEQQASMRENCRRGLWLIATCLAWTVALHPCSSQVQIWVRRAVWQSGRRGRSVAAGTAFSGSVLRGGAEAPALPRCSGDFDNAPPTLPVFYGTVEGVDHTGVYGEPKLADWVARVSPGSFHTRWRRRPARMV